MKLKLIISFIFVVAIFVVTVFFISLKTNNKYDTKNLIGQSISNFNLYSLKHNVRITEENLKKNKFTLINFWASWCGPCRKEHPTLISLSNNHKLKILGINFKDKATHASKFLKELGNPYYFIASDIAGKTSILFGIYGIPESILIDNNLKIIAKFIGPLTTEDYKKIIKIIK